MCMKKHIWSYWEDDVARSCYFFSCLQRSNVHEAKGITQAKSCKGHRCQEENLVVILGLF